MSWVDQARGLARELLEYARTNTFPPDARERIRNDPALFWLRGEEAPDGQWRSD